MMDPGSAIALANDCISMCTEAVKTLKKIIEAVKNLRNELLRIIQRAERTRKLLTIVRSLAQRLKETGRWDVDIILDQEACRHEVEKLFRLAGEMAEARLRNRFNAGFQWWRVFKETARQLCVSIEAQEEELLETVSLIHVHITLDGLETMRKIQAKVDSQDLIVDPFDGLTLHDGASTDEIAGGLVTFSNQMWLGYVMKEGLEQAYVEARDKLADAAYIGDWSSVKEHILLGEERWRESWVNAFRLQPRHCLERQSLWTPLHQAVFNDAPLDVVRWLIERGAFRTLRTRTSDFAYQDMTALELAQSFGYTHMFDILKPVICHLIPHDTIMSVQERFHSLIKRQLGEESIYRQRLRLPLLEPLTEMSDGVIWFPLRGHTFSDAGFAFRLDGRDLVVLSQNVTQQNESQVFRINTSTVEPVEKALLVNEIVE